MVALEPSAGPVPPPTRVVIPFAIACGDQGVDTLESYLLPELRADVVDVHIERAGRDDVFLSRNGLSLVFHQTVQAHLGV